MFGQEELLEDEPDLLGRSSVPMTCRSVDLPDPEGPTIATSSHRRTEKDTPRRAATGGCSP
jgi:hypothetical protein